MTSDLVAFSDPLGLGPPVRLLVVADRFGRAQEAAFLEPLGRWREAGAAAVRVIEERALDALRADGGEDAVRAFLERQFLEVRPTALVLSRYAGRERLPLIGLADAYGLPLTVHLDEDLFEAPIALGAETYRRLRHPRRVHELFRLVEAADLVQVATPELGAVVSERFPGKSWIATHDVIGPGPDLLPRGARAKTARDEIRIAFMGSQARAFDFELAAPALMSLVRREPRARLYLLGEVGDTPVGRDFGDLATRLPLPADHAAARRQLADRDIDIGLCPLRASTFNDCRAPGDWADFTAAGVPVIASANAAHTRLAGEDALALCADDGWGEVLGLLATAPERRSLLVEAARRVLERDHSAAAMERRVLDLLALANAPMSMVS